MAIQKRSVGGVTTASAAGGGLGAALAQLVIHIFPYMEGTEAALSVVLTVLVGLLGGYLVPPKDEGVEQTVETVYELGYDYEPGAHAGEYDELYDTGEHAAEEAGPVRLGE